jgi:hypothetical protein
MLLAVYNFGMFRDRAESPANQGFRDREPANFEAAERAPGFIARSGYPDEPGPPSRGKQVYPRFYIDRACTTTARRPRRSPSNPPSTRRAVQR